MSNIIDISRDRETDEVTQFTVIGDSGQPSLVKATPENILLYDPDDELPFEDGLYEFLNGDEALILSEDDPELMIAPTGNEYCYILRVNGNTIETTPNQAEEALRGVKRATINSDFDPLVDLYHEIMSKQVRRDVINALRETFDESDRINDTASGWLIDDFYLVDWTASMYTKNDDPEENDVRRRGNGVQETDRSYEFVQLRLNRDTDPVTVSIGGSSYRLSEREMLFLAKVKWLLGRREYHSDMPFWKYADKRASVDWRTGEPETDEDENEPDLDNFSI